MRESKQSVPTLSEEEGRAARAFAMLRTIGVAENRALHFKASIVVHAALQAYQSGRAASYADAIDEQEEMMRKLSEGQLPLDEKYAHELARRALEPGGLEAAQSWIETVEVEVQGTPNSMYPNLIPTKRG